MTQIDLVFDQKVGDYLSGNPGPSGPKEKKCLKDLFKKVREDSIKKGKLKDKVIDIGDGGYLLFDCNHIMRVSVRDDGKVFVGDIGKGTKLPTLNGNGVVTPP